MTQLDLESPTAAPRLADLADDARERRFAELQERMPKAWDAWGRDLEGESVVVVPSVSLDRAGARVGQHRIRRSRSACCSCCCCFGSRG